MGGGVENRRHAQETGNRPTSDVGEDIEAVGYRDRARDLQLTRLPALRNLRGGSVPPALRTERKEIT